MGGPLLTMGETLALNARLYPRKPAARDLSRAMTFAEWNARSCRLANALLGLGLAKGDRIAVLAYNCVEWMEIYAATAKAGLVAVPINFRLIGPDIHYIADNAGAKAFIVQHDLIDRVAQIRKDLPAIAAGNWVHFGADATPDGYRSYETLLAAAPASEPAVEVTADDLWMFIYTSGTTGRPKGAMRTHKGVSLHNLATTAAFHFKRDDTCLLVMPMCHANSLYFACIFAEIGASVCVYDRQSFEPAHLFETLSKERITFTSLVPTHYIMMLSLPEAMRARFNVDSVKQLLISSAPARKDTKLAILKCFPNSELYEMYGSTEQGWATVLRPDEQLVKLGSIGREFPGSGRLLLLDAEGREVADGEVGEIYSRTPWCFDGYWQLPEKTAEAFRGAWLSVGDMARRDEDGFLYLVDRKNNMIISGGENIYPSEVENLLGGHPKVRDVAVVGRPHDKWGESVHAIVVLKDGETATEKELLDWCQDKIAGFKRPRSVSFIRDEDMPRTATGKILHRQLRGKV